MITRKVTTEAEWLASVWPDPMRKCLKETRGLIYKTYVQSHPRGRRRFRLFGVAVARRVMHLVTNPHLLKLIDAAEAFADGTGTLDKLTKLKNACKIQEFSFVFDGESEERYRECLRHHNREYHAAQAVVLLGESDARSASAGHGNAAVALEGEKAAVEAARQADLLRDIFGNPFRKVAFDRTWRSSTAVSLAKQMYESRDFSAMPILADALQDAGCENEDILKHCRDTKQVHVRGCWVVDLVLDKA
jgi:hypothetical protein